MQPVPGEAQQHTSSSPQTPAEETHSRPSHLVVLVNGLWGWQRDWKMTKRYFDDANNNGRLLVHISNANTGSLTYEGIDTCGARLAQEIHSLTLSSPSLSHISLIGHSMGGLIARYALGLLTNPHTGRVAGLRPVCFVSVAAPHIGCSSDHTEEVEWHDRPWMWLLSQIIRSGHLGSLHDTHTGAAAATADSTAAAAQSSQQQQQREEKEGAGTHMAQNGKLNSSSSSSSKAGGKVWPWKMKSVIQLLGCDSWQGPAPLAAAAAAAATALCKETAALTGSGSSSGSANANSAGKGGGSGTQQHSVSCCSCAAKGSSGSNGSSSSSGGSCAVCGSKNPQPLHGQQQQQNLTPATVAAAVPSAVYGNSCSSCSYSGRLLVTDSNGSSSSSSGSSGRPLLDFMCQDVQLRCSRCGTICNCYFWTGLKLFKFRWTYSSTGGDHLIPWSSSSLLFPHQLPKPRPAGPLPAAAWWGTPHIVEWSPDTSDNQQQQRSGQQQQQQQSEHGSEQQQQQDLEKQFDPDHHGHDNADHNLQQQQQQQQQQGADQTGRSADHADLRSDLRSAESSGGVLTQRLRALQSVDPWRHYHVVWPKICLGSSHCNIQYTGAVNFVGRAVVQHVVDSILLRSDEQSDGP